MGGCCSNQEEEHKEMIHKIISESNNSVTEEDVEELIMSTQCNFIIIIVNDTELYNIALYFKDLDVNHRSKLTNNQMLEFPYFRFSPLKPFLFRGLMLKEDKEFHDHIDDLDSPQNRTTDDIKIKGLTKTSKDSKGRSAAEIIEDQRLRDLKLPQCKKAYIGLKEFAKYLSVFNRKGSLDLKIKCNFLKTQFTLECLIRMAIRKLLIRIWIMYFVHWVKIMNLQMKSCIQ